jgi:hypothetical protein
MKKLIVILSFATLLATNAFSQKYLIQAKSTQNDKWGYIDIEGNFVIQPQYDKCYEFSDGLAAVYSSKDKEFFFIAANGGKVVTDIKGFKLIDRMGFSLENFSDGLIPVRYNDKWGYLNTDGKLAIPAKYDEVQGFGSGHAGVKLGKRALIVNKAGEETAVEGNITLIRKFSEDLAPFESDDKFGFLDTNGKVVIKAQYESVGYFKNGIAWAKTTDGKVGYMDKTGAWVIEPQFTVGGNFDSESGMARIKTGSEWGYVNKEGNVLRVKESTVWEDFADGLAMGKKDGLFGYFNNKGEWIIKPQFDGGRDFKNGYAAAKKGKLWGMIDKSGNWVVEPKFDGIKDAELVK